MAKAKARRRWFRRRSSGPRRKPAFTLPLLIVAGIIPGVAKLWEAKQWGLNGIAITAERNYLGYDPVEGKMNYANLWYGTLPLVMGVLGHYLASKLGINRALGRAGIPVLRL